MITFPCPHCESELDVKDESAGKRGRCPRCQAVIRVPNSVVPDSNANAAAALPHKRSETATQWYCVIGESRHGPMREEVLKALIREGDLMSSHLVWREGMEEWRPASSVEALRSLFKDVPGCEPPPIPSVSKQEASEIRVRPPGNEEGENGKASAKDIILRVLAAIAIFYGSFWLLKELNKPSDEELHRHMDEAERFMRERELGR